jgi:PTH1 family peptidyl-tRNA hydrolase
LAFEPDGHPRIRAVVGLGNPGPRYERTRHNAGFLVLERFRREAGASWTQRADRQEASVDLGTNRLILGRPLTFMNRSGPAVLAFLADRALAPEEVLVVLDDTAIPEGRLRIRPRGGPGGHRGLQSILAELGTEELPRLRLGVGAPPEGEDLADFVLAQLDGPGWERFDEAVGRAAEAVRVLCRHGLEKGMNLFNSGPDLPAKEPDTGPGPPDPGERSPSPGPGRLPAID